MVGFSFGLVFVGLYEYGATAGHWFPVGLFGGECPGCGEGCTDDCAGYELY